jgi:hypothetical protein
VYVSYIKYSSGTVDEIVEICDECAKSDQKYLEY